MAYVPLKWLADHVEVREGLTADGLAADLVRVGLEEEAVVPAAVKGPLVVGRVITREPKEQKNGKIINYCRVDVGEHNDAPGEGAEPADVASRGIICGAQNFDAGDYVVVALPGAELPGGFAISARKTYGHISDGMMCSERELGLGDSHDGIIILPQKFASEDIPPVGHSALDLLGLNEEILEINITPDRGYCFSMRGVAREYSHSTGATFRDPGLAENLPGGQVPPATDDGFPVIIADDAPIRGRVGCDRFVVRLIEGFNPAAPTPAWMVKRLEAAGMRSISLAVDVTNYVMLDLGQPLHAYDAEKVVSPLVVRRARAGEHHVTLDGIDRELDPQDLCITDSEGGHAERVLGIAGVMGGEDTEITDSTTRILIEAAHFDAVSLARSSRRHKIPSESAKRNERGTDPQLPPVAAQVAANLLTEYGGGTVSAAVTDIDHTQAPTPITMPVSEAARTVGVDYSPERVVELLEMIGCQVRVDGDNLVVVPPTWRPDLVGPAHLVEEVARLDGYDAIPSIRPASPAGRGLTGIQRGRRNVARALADTGLTEVLSYPFIGDAHDRQGLSADDPRREVVRIANPLSEDQPGLRRQVLDTLLPVAERNRGRGIEDIAIFEIGRVTEAGDTVGCDIPGVESAPTEVEREALANGVPAQPWHVGAVLSGPVQPLGFEQSARHCDWRDAVDVVRMIASTLGVHVEIANPTCPVEDRMPFHPGRVAEIKACGQTLGWAGALHPCVAREYGLAEGASAVEIELSMLLQLSGEQPPITVRQISTYPLVKEDMAFVVDDSVEAGEVAAAIARAGGDLVESLALFDVFAGEQVGEGKKSLAFAIRLRAADRTLKGKEIAAVRKKIVTTVRSTCGGELRA